MPVEEIEVSSAEELHRIIETELRPHFEEWGRCRSTAELRGHPMYRARAPLIQKVLSNPEIGDHRRGAAAARSRYRFLAWNIERGIHLERQIEALRSHPYLSTADVLLLTEADVGMARSGNQAVAQAIARELGMSYAFAPCYLNLSKGAGVEHELGGSNRLGLHGNAVLSRYPIEAVRPIPLRNGRDKMAGREKRLGAQVALAAAIAFPNCRLTAVSVHLDAQSTRRHRRDQMKQVIEALPGDGPVLIGGDWNTTTYNSASALRAILGFWRRVFMGVGNVIENHYLHPDRLFERELFLLLERRGFDYRSCNRLGERTMTYDVADVKTRKNLGEWVPAWCFAFIRWALRNHGGCCPLKVDWFATRGLRAESPMIVHDLREGRTVPLSDHDAIGVDVVIEPRPNGRSGRTPHLVPGER